jgi:hypothetical protein
MIPKIIWHTYETKYELLPDNIKLFRESWIKDYPDFKHQYMDAKQREDFVLNEYGKDWYNIFIKLPHNIMRADVWRHMILYKYGGIYFDLDTSPIYNINKWLKDEYSFITFGDESEEVFLFYYQVIASAPNNPIGKSVLDVMFNQFNSYEYKNDNPNGIHFICKYSGELPFIKGIKNLLDPNNTISPIAKHNSYNELELSKKHGFHCYAEEYDTYDGKAFNNVDGANSWTLGYNSWYKDIGSGWVGRKPNAK